MGEHFVHMHQNENTDGIQAILGQGTWLGIDGLWGTWGPVPRFPRFLMIRHKEVLCLFYESL
jgi:hypothetical protein